MTLGLTIPIQISYAVYEHKTYRLLTMVRGSLISLIFDKTLRMNSSDAEDAEAITLMSADIDRINSGIDVVHDFYASLVESAIGLWLLYKFLGLSVVAPILWVAGMIVLLPHASSVTSFSAKK
jgi:ATP-binding cassette subfamily C (CFTR/MRP) protein 1